jgi:opacity protein-like surface antigen
VRPRTILTAALVATVLAPGRARADLTAFVGVNATPANRPVTGIAVGVGVLVVGVEFEYANTREDAAAAAPALKTGMFNLLVQTPFPVAGLQVYGTAGGGVYREQFGEDRHTHVGANVGGGAKITLAGPLRLRLDYRIFTLRGAPRERRPQRFYAGLNLAF